MRYFHTLAHLISATYIISLGQADASVGRLVRPLPFLNTTRSSHSRSLVRSSGAPTLACKGCVLQADARQTLSYHLEVEQVTGIVQLVPYVTVFPNTTVTSWSTITQAPQATTGHNSTAPITTFDSLSTELTWDWNGVPLTYPTTYIGYVLDSIVGGVPDPTTTIASRAFGCGKAALNPIPVVTPPPFSELVFPQDSLPSTDVPYKLPLKLLDYFAGQPNISSFFGGHDIHTCTTQTLQNVEFHTVGVPPEVQKTSVLVLTTQTGTPVVRTVSTPPVDTTPTPLPDNSEEPPSSNTEVPNSGPQAGSGSGGQSDQSGSGASSGSGAQSGGGTGAAINDLLFGTSVNGQASSGGQVSGSSAASGNGGSTNQGGTAGAIVNALFGSATGSNVQGSNSAPVSNQGSAEINPGGSGTGVENAIVSALFGAGIGSATPSSLGLQGAQPVFPPVLSVGTQAITANAAGNFVIGTATIHAGGSAFTTDGTIISLGINNVGSTVAVVNGISTPLSPAQPAVLTVGSQIVTANAAGSFVVGSSTLQVGGSQLVTGGTTISLATNSAGATVAVINGITSALNSPTSLTAITAPIIAATNTPSAISQSALFLPKATTTMGTDGASAASQNLCQSWKFLGAFVLVSYSIIGLV